jgi:hypothetical protein
MKRLIIVTIAIIVIITYLVIRLIIEAANLNPCKGKKLIEQGSCVSKCSELNPYIDGRTCVPNCPVTKPFIDGEYCVERCPLDKPFLKNGVECVSSCLPGIAKFNVCSSGECDTKYTDQVTGECSDIITEGKYALGKFLVAECPDKFYNTSRECDSIGNKKWSSVAVSKDGKQIYAAYKDDVTGKYNMYIIRNKEWKVSPDIKDEDYIGDIKISNNIVIYRNSNNSNSFNTYKISEDYGITFNQLSFQSKDVDLDYNGLYIIYIGTDTQYGSNIYIYNLFTKQIDHTIDSDTLVALYQQKLNQIENEESVPGNFVDSKTPGISISWVQSKPHLHSVLIKFRTLGYNRAVKCRIGQLSNDNSYRIMIATKNMIMTTKLDFTDVQYLTFGPKDFYQFVYDKMGYMYDFAVGFRTGSGLSGNIATDDDIKRWTDNIFPSRDGYANQIKQFYEDRKLNLGFAWGSIRDIKVSNDMSRVYVDHIFNADLYFRLFASCSNAELGKGRRDNFYCCLCNREGQEYKDNFDEGDIYVTMMKDYDNALSRVYTRPDLLRKYISVIYAFDTRGQVKKTETETHLFTETYENLSLSTTYKGNNVGVFNTTKSPLINLSLNGNSLKIVPFTSFTNSSEVGWETTKTYNFNNIYTSKHKVSNLDGKYIIASVDNGPLFYSENFGVSWIKI